VSRYSRRLNPLDFTTVAQQTLFATIIMEFNKLHRFLINLNP